MNEQGQGEMQAPSGEAMAASSLQDERNSEQKGEASTGRERGRHRGGAMDAGRRGEAAATASRLNDTRWRIEANGESARVLKVVGARRQRLQRPAGEARRLVQSAMD